MIAVIRGPWPRKSLGEVAEVVSGYAFKSSEFGERGVPVIKIKNVRVGYVDLSEVDRVDDKYLSIPVRYHVQGGDVLISLTGAHISQPNSVVGRVARHSVGLPNCLLNQRAGKVIVRDSSKCDLNFLFYALGEQENVHVIAMKAHGAVNQANASPKQVERVVIPLPPLPIQQRIASILSVYDELIENSQRRIKILESMARVLYRERFIHFRFPDHENHPRVASLLGEIPPVSLMPEFVYCLARSDDFRGVAIKSMSGASGRQRVQEKCFEDFQIAHPPHPLLEKFSSIVGPNFRLVYSLNLQIQNLRCTRDLLLPRLLSGQVNVETLDYA